MHILNPCYASESELFMVEGWWGVRVKLGKGQFKRPSGLLQHNL